MTEFEKAKNNITTPIDMNKLCEELSKRNEEWYRRVFKALACGEEPSDADCIGPATDTLIALGAFMNKIGFAIPALPLVAAAFEMEKNQLLARVPEGAEAFADMVKILEEQCLFISRSVRKKIEVDDEK